MFQDEKGRRVIRLGDTTSHGGKVITGAEMWDVFGKPVARVGDKVICPRCDNKVYEIIEGNQKITVFNRPIAFEGHRISCGATLISSLGREHRSSPTTSDYSGSIGGGAGGSSNASYNTHRSTQKKGQRTKKYGVTFLLVDSNGGKLPNMPYKVLHNGELYDSGVSDKEGKTVEIESDTSINLHVKIDIPALIRSKR